MGNDHKEAPISLDDDKNGNGFTEEVISFGESVELEVQQTRDQFGEKQRSERPKEEPEAEAEKRGIGYDQWMALLHVAEAFNHKKAQEWIDKTFTFPGNGKIRIEGNWDLKDHASLGFLPNGLEIDRRLDVGKKNRVIALPEDIKVPYLCVDSSKVQILPYQLDSLENLSAIDCPNLGTATQELTAKSNVFFVGCPSLKIGPKKLIAGRSVFFVNCPSMRMRLRVLRVGGNFSLTNCPAVDTFPRDTFIGGDVIVSGDTNKNVLIRIEKLKKDGKIGGEIIYEGGKYKHEDKDKKDGDKKSGGSNPQER